MASERIVYHVVPHARAECWVVVSKNDPSFRDAYNTQEEAVTAAKEHAKRQHLAQVKVQKQDSKVEYESAYGEDPLRSPS